MNVDEAEYTLAFNTCYEKILNQIPREGYCNTTWDSVMCWDAVPAGTYVPQICPQYVRDISKTGFAARECDETGNWANNEEFNITSEGWTNYSDCFKPDPVFVELSKDLSRIQLMSNIGYGISLASLTVAVLLMLCSRRIHCKSNSLHINLFIAFILRASISFIKECLFVHGLGLKGDVDISVDGAITFNDEGTHWQCKLLMTSFMYAVAASLMWIFMEGLYLHMLVYKTLFTERTGVRMYVIIGWFSPLIYIIPWILVRVTVDNELCWNTDDKGFIWIIKGPIIVTILINFSFFVNIVRVLCLRMKTQHRHTKGANRQIRNLAKFSLVLIPLFGVLYIGFAAYPPGLDLQADIIYLYGEMFYNSFQGVLLAVLFCFLNEEVHNEIRRCWYRNRGADNSFTRSFNLTSNRKGSTNASHTSHAYAVSRDKKHTTVTSANNENPLLPARNQTDTNNHSMKPLIDSDDLNQVNTNTLCDILGYGGQHIVRSEIMKAWARTGIRRSSAVSRASLTSQILQAQMDAGNSKVTDSPRQETARKKYKIGRKSTTSMTDIEKSVPFTNSAVRSYSIVIDNSSPPLELQNLNNQKDDAKSDDINLKIKFINIEYQPRDGLCRNTTSIDTETLLNGCTIKEDNIINNNTSKKVASDLDFDNEHAYSGD